MPDPPDEPVFSPEYSAGSQTSGESKQFFPSRRADLDEQQEAEHRLYGLSKPKRVIVRGKIAAD